MPATRLMGHRVTWREFRAESEDLERLDEAWNAVGETLRSTDDPSLTSLLAGDGSRVLDGVTRALCAMDSTEPRCSVLLIDSGPVPFRWALLALCADFFEAILVYGLDTHRAETTHEALPPSTAPPGERIIEHPERLLGVSRSDSSARLLRALSGVPAITLRSVRCLVQQRSARAPFLTIVIPTLDSRGLQDSMQSIAAQELTFDVEVLVMQASTGQERAEVRSNEASFPPELTVFVTTVADQSPYEAMNAALNLARSQWVYFLGSGDTFDGPGVLESMHAILAEAPGGCGMVYGNVRMVGDGPGAADGEIYAGEFSYDRLRKQNICHQAIFYRLSALVALGGFDSKYAVNADWALNLRGWHDFQPIFTDTVVANFVRGGLSTSTWDTAFFEDLERFWEQHRPVVDDKGSPGRPHVDPAAGTRKKTLGRRETVTAADER